MAARATCIRTGIQCSAGVVGINLTCGSGFFPNDYNNPQELVSKQNQVTINGESRNFPEAANLSDVVRELKLEPERVAVELIAPL